MRYYYNFAIILVLGLAGGGFTAKWALEAEDGFGSVKYNRWTSWPLAGSVDADPYTKARVARDGSVPLGAAEGLTFFLLDDEKDQLLRRECQYSLMGTTPPARLWTLSVQDQDKQPIAAYEGGENAIFSESVLRAQDGTFVINIGSQPAPMNWLTVAGTGPMRLVLRLYDTPVTSSSGLDRPAMPKLTVRDCKN